MQTHKTTTVTLWHMRQGLMTFKCMVMVRWVFSRKNTRNVRLHVSKKEWGGGKKSSLAYVEVRSGGTSFPSCSVNSLLAMLAMHCMASVLKVGLRDSRSCRIDWMIRFIRSWPCNVKVILLVMSYPVLPVCLVYLSAYVVLKAHLHGSNLSALECAIS